MAENCTEQVYTAYQFKVRAGTAMPVEGSEGNRKFKWHTFMAEKSLIESYLCTSNLPASSEFRGQGGELASASFKRIADVSGELFSGKKVYNPEIVDEDDYTTT